MYLYLSIRNFVIEGVALEGPNAVDLSDIDWKRQEAAIHETTLITNMYSYTEHKQIQTNMNIDAVLHI